jgi:hypothetical protein
VGSRDIRPGRGRGACVENQFVEHMNDVSLALTLDVLIETLALIHENENESEPCLPRDYDQLYIHCPFLRRDGRSLGSAFWNGDACVGHGVLHPRILHRLNMAKNSFYDDGAIFLYGCGGYVYLHKGY